MKTIILKIDDSIFKKVIGFLELLPKDRLEILVKDGIKDISFVDDKEQKEIQEMLKEEECFEVDLKENLKIWD